MPATSCLLNTIKTISIGIVIIITSANSRLKELEYCPIKLYRVCCTVMFSAPGRKYNGFVKSLNIVQAFKMIIVAVTGLSSGKIICLKSCKVLHPSM